MTIIEQLENAQSLKVKNYQILAKYFKEKGLEIENKKIDDIVADTYVSGATIVRFCKKLGYPGFSNFKYELCEEYRVASYNVESQLSMTYFNKLNLIHQKLKPMIQDKKIYEAIERIKSKTTVVVLCDDADYNICQDFKNFLIRKGKIVMCTSDKVARDKLLSQVNGEVLYIVVDFLGEVTFDDSYAKYNNIYVISNTQHRNIDNNLVIPQIAETDMCAIRLNQTVLKNVLDLVELNI